MLYQRIMMMHLIRTKLLKTLIEVFSLFEALPWLCLGSTTTPFIGRVLKQAVMNNNDKPSNVMLLELPGMVLVEAPHLGTEWGAHLPPQVNPLPRSTCRSCDTKTKGNHLRYLRLISPRMKLKHWQWHLKRLLECIRVYIYIYTYEICNILQDFATKYLSLNRKKSRHWGRRRLKDQAARANGSPSSFVETSSLTHGWLLPAWNSRAQLRSRQLHQHRSCDGHWPCQRTVLQPFEAFLFLYYCSRASWCFHNNMFVFLADSEPKTLRV